MSMPTIFVSHGSPMLILEDVPARAFLASLGKLLPKPKAIIAVSAHWDTDVPAVSLARKPSTIHDFYGFPEALYRLRYDAKGAPELAERVAKLTGAAHDPHRGLDHGAWVPAMLAWPDADIPVFQLSVQPNESPAHHIALGRKLGPLREEGVLVMGSGSATHNLRALVRGAREAEPEPWAKAFDDWLADTLEKGDERHLGGLPSAGPPCARGSSHRRALPAAARRLRRGRRRRTWSRPAPKLHARKSVDGLLRVRVGGQAASASVTPLSFRSCSSSPVSNISRTMSQPPTNSPLT